MRVGSLQETLPSSAGIPRVSVIIPTYNHAGFVPQAIESVLSQTYGDAEIIVVDDGSTDDTPSALAAYTGRIHAVRQENKGLAAARNTGICHSHGEFLVFLDADDLLEPQKLAIQAAALDSHTEWGVVYSGWYYVGPDGKQVLATQHPKLQGNLLEPWLLRQFFFPPGAAMVRRRCLEVCGFFEETMRAAEDTDLWFRIAQAGFTFGYTDDVLFRYRLMPGSLSRNVEHQMRHEFMRLDRVYAQPGVDARLLALKGRAYGILFVEAAGKYFLAGDIPQAQDALRRAAQLCPALVADAEWMSEWLAGAALDPRVEQPLRFIQTVLSQAPDEITGLKKSARRTLARYHIAAVFTYFNVHDHSKLLAHVVPAIWGDPSILFNKGFLRAVFEARLRQGKTALPVVRMKSNGSGD